LGKKGGREFRADLWSGGGEGLGKREEIIKDGVVQMGNQVLVKNNDMSERVLAADGKWGGEIEKFF